MPLTQLFLTRFFCLITCHTGEKVNNLLKSFRNWWWPVFSCHMYFMLSLYYLDVYGTYYSSPPPPSQHRPLGLMSQDYGLDFTPLIILRIFFIDPLIQRSLDQSITLVPFYIKPLCLYYRYLESEKPSLAIGCLILNSCNG